MSCQSKSGRVAKLAGRVSSGLSQLSSKQAFFTGLALGASGTGLGALLAANRQRIAALFGGAKPPRQAIAGPGQSAAPRPKKQPKPIPALAAGKRSNAKPKPIPGLTPSPTTLQPAAVEMKTGGGEPYVAQNSYRVRQTDGGDTGLAITPYLEAGPANGEPAIQEGVWGVTHTGSGALIDGPYDSIEQAQTLAAKLSSLPWSGAMSKPDIGRAKRIVQAHRQSLKGAAR